MKVSKVIGHEGTGRAARFLGGNLNSGRPLGPRQLMASLRSASAVSDPLRRIKLHLIDKSAWAVKNYVIKKKNSTNTAARKTLLWIDGS